VVHTPAGLSYCLGFAVVCAFFPAILGRRVPCLGRRSPGQPWLSGLTVPKDIPEDRDREGGSFLPLQLSLSLVLHL
jgi:hypothetical protein